MKKLYIKFRAEFIAGFALSIVLFIAFSIASMPSIHTEQKEVKAPASTNNQIYLIRCTCGCASNILGKLPWAEDQIK